MVKPTENQLKICNKMGVNPDPPEPHSKIGISNPFSNDNFPINGLRHPPEQGTNGWYIWSGENLSQSENFFEPLHITHLEDYSPEIVKYLALPPGWRFLYTPGYEDIWFDESLFDI